MSTPAPQPKPPRKRRPPASVELLSRIESHLRLLTEHSAIMVCTLERLEALATSDKQGAQDPSATSAARDRLFADKLPDPRVDPSMDAGERRMQETRTRGVARYLADDDDRAPG